MQSLRRLATKGTKFTIAEDSPQKSVIVFTRSFDPGYFYLVIALLFSGIHLSRGDYFTAFLMFVVFYGMHIIFNIFPYDRSRTITLDWSNDKFTYKTSGYFISFKKILVLKDVEILERRMPTWGFIQFEIWRTVAIMKDGTKIPLCGYVSGIRALQEGEEAIKVNSILNARRAF